MTFETHPFRPFRARPFVVALAAAAMFASAAMSGASASTYVVAEAEIEAVPTGSEVIVAAADCYSIGQQVAAQKGGELYGANAATRGGQEVCVIVVLVPGKNGKPPRREQVTVPAR